MQPVSQADNALDAATKTVGDEIGVARFHQGPSEIVVPGRSEVSDLAPTHDDMPVRGIGWVRWIMDLFLRVKPGFQGGQADNNFKN